MNIDEIKIKDEVLGLAIEKETTSVGRYANVSGIVTDKTTNTVELHLLAKTVKGISCKEWLTLRDFNRLFEIKSGWT